MKKGFTLAEVLITLGIIGVVASLTLPTLIQKYQKHVWYTQFRKAATVLENAINQYNLDHACGTKVQSEPDIYDNLCYTSESDSPAEKLSKYLQIVKWINDDNWQEVCKGYEKLPPAQYYDGSDRQNGEPDYCANVQTVHDYMNGYGFITKDGILINFETDDGFGSGSFVDINGPNKGPNIYGRDIFVFYLFNPPSKHWGYPKDKYNHCYDDNKFGDNCGIRLLQEGKMNY